jgi:tetratricopeptide (TPR) repeat protein
MKRVWVTALVFCVISIVGFALMQAQIDKIRTPRERLEEKLVYIPETRFLRAASLGFHAVLADVFWARTVVYFGGHFLTDQDYRWLYRILDATTTLDPKNILAYRFGGTLLALEEDDVEDSIKLLKKGIQDNPDEDWRLYYLLGFNYFFYLEDYATAAKYLEKASTMPGRPNYLPRLVARMYAKGGRMETAIQFLKETYHQYEDENVKESIAGRLNILMAKQQISQLESAAEVYKKGYGEYPKDLKELIGAGLVKELPEYPDGEYVIYRTGKVDWVSESSPNWP